MHGPPRIFIGGTGRSGTSILYQALGCHEAVHSFPQEMRFLVDPDGLLTLVDALTGRYSVHRASEALFRFERLMRVYTTVPHRAPYQNFDFASWLGGAHYWQRLEEFCSEIVELEYNGTAWPIEPEFEGRLVTWAKKLQILRQRLQREPVVPFRLSLPRPKMKLAKYFSDRSRLVALAAAFVDDLFLYAAHENGKQTWCEKTPQNLFHLDFLWELFPESMFIHVKRDPRGVVQSLTKQRWSPKDMTGAALFLRAMYDRWFDLKRVIDLNHDHYLELKLEDLGASPRAVLERITSFCQLEGCFENVPAITIDKINYWQQTMTTQEVQLVNDILGSRIERMGYEV